MAFIPPIVAPLLQMVKDLTAALNETRQYLGLPPIDAQQLIDKAYAQSASPSMPKPEIPIPEIPKPEALTPEKPKPENPKTDSSPVTPDGKYTARLVDLSKSGKPCFDPAKFCSDGIFIITIAGGKATFCIKSPLSDAERESWSMLGAPDVCDGSYEPIYSDEPVTDKPGEAAFVDGVWVVTDFAELS